MEIQIRLSDILVAALCISRQHSSSFQITQIGRCLAKCTADCAAEQVAWKFIKLMVEVVWNDWSFLGLMDQRFHINAAGLKSIDDRNGIPFFQADFDQKIYCITVDPDTILQYMIVVFDSHAVSGHDLHNPAPFCKIP